MRHKIALARCCRSTDIYWILAVVQEEIQNIFLEQGFYVDATDGSEEMCHIASNYTGIQVRRLLFEELDENKNMMAYGPARQYFIFLRMNLKPCL